MNDLVNAVSFHCILALKTARSTNTATPVTVGDNKWTLKMHGVSKRGALSICEEDNLHLLNTLSLRCVSYQSSNLILMKQASHSTVNPFLT